MLEKILEEIDNLKKLYVEKAFNLIDEGNLPCEYDKSDVEAAKVKALSEAMAIIRKHLSGKDTNVPTNDGWIPVEERLPENKRANYEVTFVNECGYEEHGFAQWYDGEFHIPAVVIAWREHLEPYHPEKGE